MKEPPSLSLIRSSSSAACMKPYQKYHPCDLYLRPDWSRNTLSAVFSKEYNQNIGSRLCKTLVQPRPYRRFVQIDICLREMGSIIYFGDGSLGTGMSRWVATERKWYRMQKSRGGHILSASSYSNIRSIHLWVEGSDLIRSGLDMANRRWDKKSRRMTDDLTALSETLRHSISFGEIIAMGHVTR